MNNRQGSRQGESVVKKQGNRAKKKREKKKQKDEREVLFLYSDILGQRRASNKTRHPPDNNSAD